MITVSIFGCCVLRDAIEFEDKTGLIKVDRFVQFINPMTIFRGKPVLSDNIFDQNKLNGNNFSRRCMMLDFNKMVFDYLAEVKSEYIMLDISSLVMYFYAMENGTSFTECRIFKNNEDIVLQSLGIDNNELLRYRRGIFDLSVNEIKSVMKLYANRILKMYKPSQIILVELKMAEKYIDLETGNKAYFWNNMTSTHLQNGILKIAYEILKNELGTCHTITFPEETYGNFNHKWGKYQLHYWDAYYKYLWNEMMKIMNQK